MLSKALEGTAQLGVGQQKEGLLKLQEIDWKQFLQCEVRSLRDISLKLKLQDHVIPEAAVSKAVVDPDSVPSWRKAVERVEKERSRDVLPALPQPKISGTSQESKIE